MARKEKEIISGYDFRTEQSRLVCVPDLFEKAKAARTMQENEWEIDANYYNFIRTATSEMKEYCEERGIPWVPAVSPDPWIMVESQIDPNVPTPEFRGRDTDTDGEKAKMRESAVKYILENNDVDHQNTENERRLLKLGDAFWGAYYDKDMRCGIAEGDIAVKAISPEAIFPDPSVRTGNIQDCMYVAHVYTMHKVAFWQRYKKRLRKLDRTPDELQTMSYVPESSIFDLSTAIDDTEDTVQVLEFWFKWPDDATVETPDGKKVQVEAGDVACSIQAGDVELRFIPTYWKNTHRQCRLFPFVHYWRIRNENSFWNFSEIYPIRDLVDAQDRKLGSTLLNDMFLSNDIIICEEGAVAEGSQLTNAPGETVYVKPGKGGAVARLGGLQTAPTATILLNYLKEQIERTNRNYETNLGKETSRQTTATGLAMLREDASSQNNIKQQDRLAGFARLFELLDWLALEFFDDERLLYLGVNKDKGREEAVSVHFNSETLAEEMPEVYDAMTGEIVRDKWKYWPKVDVTVTAGDGVIKGKQATLSALNTLVAAQVTQDNYKMYKAMLDIIDIPQKQEIFEEWEQKFGAGEVPPELIEALKADPQLMQTVMQFIQQPQEMPQGMMM